MTDPRDAPRRIVIKKVSHKGHHGGAWKVAYADFVTAMMALFIVLWIVGQGKPVREAVAAYFKDPTIFSGSAGVMKGGAGSTGTVSLGPAAAPSPPAGPERPGGPSAKTDLAALEATAAHLRDQIHRDAKLVGLEDKIKIELTDEGLRIQLLETTQGVFFDVGSAQVKPATKEVLGMIAQEVGRLPNDLILEGHTDSRPYVGLPSYSNWELSADRANAARRALVTSGLRADQVASVVGYADRRLANQSDSLDGSNRRISIIVRFQKAAIGLGSAIQPPVQPTASPGNQAATRPAR
jgi:chemotaxis protein MotB